MAGGSASSSMTPPHPRPIPHSSSPSAEWSIVTSTGASSSSASRAKRAASSSRQPPLINPTGAPCSGTSSRARGRRYDEPRTDTTVASATRSPRARAPAAAARTASISLTWATLPATLGLDQWRQDPLARGAAEELAQQRVEALRLLQVEHVRRAIEDLEACARDGTGEVTHRLPGARIV